MPQKRWHLCSFVATQALREWGCHVYVFLFDSSFFRLKVGPFHYFFYVGRWVNLLSWIVMVLLGSMNSEGDRRCSTSTFPWIPDVSTWSVACYYQPKRFASWSFKLAVYTSKPDVSNLQALPIINNVVGLWYYQFPQSSPQHKSRLICRISQLRYIRELWWSLAYPVLYVSLWGRMDCNISWWVCSPRLPFLSLTRSLGKPQSLGQQPWRP